MMPLRASSWRTIPTLCFVLGALSATTLVLAQQTTPQPPNVLSEELLASPPGSSRTQQTQDLFDGPLANCTLRGPIENAQCNYEQVDTINEDFYARLQALVETPYFRYYKTDLDKSCPFWPDDSLCTNRNCAVQTLDESDVPEKYRVSTLSHVLTTPDQVVANLSGGTGSSSCHCDEAEFCHWDDEYSPNAVFVDLRQNPERFTGYAGPSAGRIWKSIYEENCFGVPGKASGSPVRLSSNAGIGMSSDQSFNPAASQAFASFLSSLHPDQRMDLADEEDEGGVCLEKRVFYRIVSGLHASISIHICDEFLDKETGVWGPNEKCFRFRIANFPERLQNLYFDYVLFLRALARVGEQAALQSNFTITSPGNEIDDPESRAQFSQLLTSATRLKPTFDERSMFARPDAAGLREEFKHRFRNITSIMDCVGCDKCRLWGKLQTSGVATALKILFAYDDRERPVGAEPFLKRSELVALVNTANRFAESLKAVERFRSMYLKSLESELDPSASSTNTTTGGQATTTSTQNEPGPHPSHVPSSTSEDEVTSSEDAMAVPVSPSPSAHATADDLATPALNGTEFSATPSSSSTSGVDPAPVEDVSAPYASPSPETSTTADEHSVSTVKEALSTSTSSLSPSSRPSLEEAVSSEETYVPKAFSSEYKPLSSSSPPSTPSSSSNSSFSTSSPAATIITHSQPTSTSTESQRTIVHEDL